MNSAAAHSLNPMAMSRTSLATSDVTARRAHSSSHMTSPLLDAPTRQAVAIGASFAPAGRVHQQGGEVCVFHASSFGLVQRGTQRRIRLFVFMKALMTQMQLPLLARLDAPSIAPLHYVRLCKSFREAVRMCWALRRVHGMTLRQLAAEAELRPQLVTDYLHADDAPTRRNLPAEQIAAFEAVAGNCLISQWIAARAQLTVLEQLQAQAA